MCGIAGIYDPSLGPPPETRLLKRMNDSQTHRGPDEEGIHRGAGIGLAHRRLSIIDLSSGQQPLYNEDHSVVTVYNGEIYNFQELTEELSSLGHRFRTRSDTEAIVHAWEEWGESCVEHFRGMFAFAVWDSNRNTLFLARDRLGIKPLYYAELSNGCVVFGSELKSVLVHPGVERRLDHAAVEDYFAYGYIPEPRTILQTVKKLAPGHTLTYSPGTRGTAQRRYWDVPFNVQTGRSQESIEAELIERIREAVRLRLISEVPLGAFLSGGVDSSAVVSMMAGLSKDPVNTCTISFGVSTEPNRKPV